MLTNTVVLKNRGLLRQQAFVNGQWIDASNKDTYEVLNPATGAVIATVPSLSADEVELAIHGAAKAQKDWAAKTAQERSRILRRWFELMHENAEDLALLMTTEQGKPLAEARGEVAYAASFIEWFSEEARRVYGRIIPQPSNDRRLMVMKQPIGVVGAITPWNFPAAMLTRKAGPALAAGCAMVAKPAEDTPLTALALGVLAAEAGVPDGVLNIVTGKPDVVGPALMGSSIVRKVSFTGSTAVGKLLMRQAADTVKKLSLELGGNAPFIVFDDADVDAAVDGVMASKYRNTGQTCVCANRIFVQSGIYDSFTQKLAEKVSTMKVGAGTEDGVVQGPLINKAALEKVKRHVADAKAKGGRVLTGGDVHERGGSFFQPTVIADATPDMQVFVEETFGPVAPIFRFETEDEAVALANDTPFGLASYFFSRDLARIFRAAEALESGIVAVNSGVFSTEVAPFGGVKESGLGREGGQEGIEEYLETKFLCLGL
ncbi:NAD-dependent succinate-semialdehyde dehydrogenase [Iodidimonas muriae]|uniref:NAD-dependent succinate-semialdehyde dehydrogenase n=1 Tax=Iodidimonas muriae TaxID=261467 RepID=A0ABQ2LE40_9PROT|nr:NAD-dependent succinate-semialdehyde dehydrogenase [Iodidimonas muriae]GER07111.1 NAD-dependent succinate-semialdehyde dehydrogenase [Kordiimonadales bacterium JCM 17843]GGO12954.1 NAD-dependent succinate-semialdehyde dehydrogenase [Iodidimonas muriae]